MWCFKILSLEVKKYIYIYIYFQNIIFKSFIYLKDRVRERHRGRKRKRHLPFTSLLSRWLP